MKLKKIFILLPDGVGLRNFAFTSFVETGEKMGWKVIFWNHTTFDLSALGYSEIRIQGRARAKTDLLKRAKILAELGHFDEKFDDPVYQTYRFPPSKKGLKTQVKNTIVSALVQKFRGEKGLQELRGKIKASERRSDLYKECKKVLQQEKPDYVFCTNQRPVNAIAPLTAAQDIGIPTGTFIFSWDNLPKATMVIEPDHYFVWSEHMKKELLKYYPFISSKNIFVTGSPQFEPHFDPALRKSRKVFFEENALDPEKEYICFSGDDKTTCPDDPQYLSDLAEAVENLNRGDYNLGIIFRRSPVDFSSRYDEVLEKHKGVIVPVAPKWKQVGGSWNAVLPTKEDLELQINTILHTRAVVNLASSMVFDYGVFDKPCLYLNYEVEKKEDETWSPQKVYNFVHFRSMPSKDAVIWLQSKEEMEEKIRSALDGSAQTFEKAQEWFKKINAHPPEMASGRIWEEIRAVN